MRRVLITLRYDGSRYHGWQRQKNALCVQEVLENALPLAFPADGFFYRAAGVSRTDAFVHALNQKCVFDMPREALKCPVENLPFVLNRFLPPDVVCADACFVSLDFNVHKQTVEKTYRYQIYNDIHPAPALRQYVWHIKPALDVSAMRRAARFLTGKHNFEAFAAAGSSVLSYERTIFGVNIEQSEKTVSIYIRADGFLYNMARIITGTLVYAGLGKIEAERTEAIILSRDRAQAGITAPPQGLTLYDTVLRNC